MRSRVVINGRLHPRTGRLYVGVPDLVQGALAESRADRSEDPHRLRVLAPRADGEPLYVDATSPEDIATKVTGLMADEPYRRELAARGRRHAAQFLWRRAALRNWEEIVAVADPSRAQAGLKPQPGADP